MEKFPTAASKNLISDCLLFRKSRPDRYGLGFTLVELMIVVSIMVMIVGVALANLKEGEKTRNVKLAADNLQSSLRQMQNNVLSGVPYDSSYVACDFGIRIADVTNVTNPSYETFVERNGTGGCSANSRSLETINLNNKVIFSNLVVSGNSSSFLEVRFFPPFGEIRITSAGHTLEKNLIASFDLVFQGSTKKRIVIVDGLTGRISVQ